MMKTAKQISLVGALLLAGALGFQQNAAAQMPNVCPPGQTFVIAQGKCVATPAQQPAVNCPQGQTFNAQTNQCVTAVNCPQGQQYNAQTNQCVTAVQCPTGQRYDPVAKVCAPL
jgi:hypothetical protein